jgi:hypothetical protein
MRALSGAIITAAALIGLGLCMQGIGTRYSQVIRWKSPSGEETTSPTLKTMPDIEGSHIKIHEMDNALKLTLTLLVLTLLIGLGITFVGLMYEHHHHYHQLLRSTDTTAPNPRVTV